MPRAIPERTVLVVPVGEKYTMVTLSVIISVPFILCCPVWRTTHPDDRMITGKGPGPGGILYLISITISYNITIG